MTAVKVLPTSSVVSVHPGGTYDVKIKIEDVDKWEHDYTENGQSFTEAYDSHNYDNFGLDWDNSGNGAMVYQTPLGDNFFGLASDGYVYLNFKREVLNTDVDSYRFDWYVIIDGDDDVKAHDSSIEIDIAVYIAPF